MILEELAPKFAGMAALLAASAFFSASETAFFSLSPLELHRLRTAGGLFDRLVLALRLKPDALLITVLLGNMTVNVLYFSLAAVVSISVEREGYEVGAGVFSVLALAVLIGFGEVLPKSTTVNMPLRFARLAALPLTVLLRAAAPVRIVLEGVLSVVMRGVLSRIPSQPYITEGELKSLIHLSLEGGQIGQHEGRMLRESLALEDMTVKSIMVPRVDVVAFKVDGDRAEIMNLAASTLKTKIPIFEGSRDNIIGIVKVKNLFLHPDRTLRNLLEPVLFVPENMSVADLMKKFLEGRNARAVVVDEYGGTEGLVTLEDVTEEIVGEIKDEFDTSTEVYTRQPDGSYVLNGNLSVKEWGDVLGEEVKSGKVGTFSGYITLKLGRIPEKDDVVRHGNMEITVLETGIRRVSKLKLRFLPTPSGRLTGIAPGDGGAAS